MDRKYILDNQEELKLTPSNEQFPHHDKIKMSEMPDFDGSLLDEIQITELEEGLSGTENPYHRLALRPIGKECFTNKRMLKQKAIKPTYLWIGVSVAATLALFVSITFSPKSLKENTKNLSVVTTNHSSPTTENVLGNPKQSITKKEQVGKSSTSNPKSIAVAACTHSTSKTNHQEPEAYIATKREIPVPVIETTIKPPKVQSQIANNGSDKILTSHPKHINVRVEEMDDEEESIIQRLAQKAGIIKVASNEKNKTNSELSIKDQVMGKGIKSWGLAFNSEVVEIKEFNKEGVMTYYAIKSGKIEYQKNITAKNPD